MAATESTQFANVFTELYCNILSKTYSIKNLKFLNEVRRELENIRRLKHIITNWEQNHFFVDFKFEDVAVRCAYMYSYSVLNTSVVYSEFLKHLKDDESIVQQHFSLKILKLCCLGGGPGTEAVAISKAIHDAVWKHSSGTTDSIVEVHVTVVDRCSEWAPEVNAVVDALNGNKNLFDSQSMRFHAEFFQADLLEPFGEALQRIINEADVITIVKLVTAVHEKDPLHSIPKLEIMMQNVIQFTQDKCCLFVLDAAGGDVFNRIANVIPSGRNRFKRKMYKHVAYRLHRKPLKKLETLMDSKLFAELSTLFPAQFTRVSSCFAIRDAPPPPKEKQKRKKGKNAV